MRATYFAGLVASVGLSLALCASQASAHQTTGEPFDHVHGDQKRIVRGEQYIPTIWIDPDGCEHWVMDDGWEGFMSPKLDREGRPTCRQAKVCGIVPSDPMFKTNGFHLSVAGRKRLTEFFEKSTAEGFIITGHTDSRASDEYNMRLSVNRANSVAKVARAAGVRVVDVRGYGERQPVASNKTAAGMAKNRRVEIHCLR